MYLATIRENLEEVRIWKLSSCSFRVGVWLPGGRESSREAGKEERPRFYATPGSSPMNPCGARKASLLATPWCLPEAEERRSRYQSVLPTSCL